MPTQKIATCVYCGTRAALVLKGKTRHELSCSSCGAPLHDLKMLRRDHEEDHHRVAPSRVRGTYDPVHHSHKPKRKNKKKKSFKRKFFEEAFDLIEDIFD